MTEWLLLVLLVPAVVVPVVLLFGFAGCDFEHGVVSPREAPVILSATGKSVNVITLTWMADPTASKIKFVRTKKVPVGLPPPPHTIEVMPLPAEHDDNDGLDSATTYEYVAYAVFADGDESDASAPAEGTTLAPPTFDAAGAGNTGQGINSASTTWPHTASGNSRAVVVGLRWAHIAGSGVPTRTVTYGGTAMTSLGVVGLNNAVLSALNGIYHEFFGLLNPPTGVQTVSLTVARTGALSINIEGCSVSYAGVSEFVSVPPVAGTEAGTSLSQTVSSAVNEMVVQMFTTESGAITGYNQTLRFDGGASGPVIGDAQGAASVSFTASRATGVDYAGLAVRLKPV
jgi:hypothetical protein